MKEQHLNNRIIEFHCVKLLQIFTDPTDGKDYKKKSSLHAKLVSGDETKYREFAYHYKVVVK